MELLKHILSHEYMLAIYGVMLWQVEQYFISDLNYKEFFGESVKNIGRSMIWVGIVVVFDDEILAKYNEWAHVDYETAPLYMYTVAGFFIDVIRSNISKKVL
jgi:hypothetical protein